ncbi:TPA: hypothetical protein IRE51_002626 [Escherichia coli]|nr:hypothetical protein [Escherichia coli]
MSTAVHSIGWAIMYDNGSCKECKDWSGHNHEEHEGGICILSLADCFQLLIINRAK